MYCETVELSEKNKYFEIWRRKFIVSFKYRNKPEISIYIKQQYLQIYY